MKCLVAVKRVIDPDINVRIKSDQSGVETENVKMAMNPFDEIALEEAVRLKEKGIVSEVIAVSIGSNLVSETLRQALARGADRALLIETDSASADLEPLMIAKLLKKCVLQNEIKLVLLGKQAIDNDCNQTGQMLSAILKWSLATFASKVEVNKESNTINVEREIDGGIETIKIKLPAVITVDLRLNEPRYISLPNIMQAKRKPLEIISVTDFGVEIINTLRTIKVTAPTPRKSGVIVENIEELIDKLSNEAQVL